MSIAKGTLNFLSNNNGKDYDTTWTSDPSVTTLALSGTATQTLNLSATPPSTNNNVGFASIGSSLTFNDTDKIATFATSVNSYGQIIIQNKSSGTTASSDVVVNNDRVGGTAIYGDFGINGSTFAGTGSLALPNAVYLYSVSGDLVLGTTTNNNLHLVANSSATDAITINTQNAVAFNGSYGANTYLLQSTGNATAPIWQSPANISAGSVVSTLTFTSAGNGSASGVSFNGSAAQVVSSNTILPTQAGNSGKVLTTDGANNLSWTSAASGALATGNSAIVLNNVNITSNATVAAGQNGFSVGPVTQANGTSITIASGQRWVVI